MDIGTLVWLALLAIYAILKLASERKKMPPGTPGAPAPGQTRQPGTQPEETTLDDALREIRQALGMESPPVPEPADAGGVPVPAPAPVDMGGGTVPVPPPLREVPVPRSRLERIPVSESQIEPPSAFGREDAFERSGAVFDSWTPEPTSTLPLTNTLEVVDVAEAAPAARPSARKTVGRLVGDPRRAREAFVLAEVLGKPVSRRRR